MQIPYALIILDGFGYSPTPDYNAIAQAHTPCFDYLLAHYPHTLLQASGSYVGLLPGMQGNSEVGHLTIGTGQVIQQPAVQIVEAIKNHSLYHHELLVANFQQLQKDHQSLHIMGILSDGAVHGMQDLIHELIAITAQYSFPVYIHAILDGRDVAPQSASHYLQQLERAMSTNPHCRLGSIQGRFYAMDRDKQWDRTQATYEVLTRRNQEIHFDNWQQAIASYYSQGITDEFIPPTLLHPSAIVKPHDGIIVTNYRPDRARQLTQAFLEPQCVPFKTEQLPLSFFITPVLYNADFHNPTLFKKPIINHTLKQQLSHAGLRIFSIAETEKYAHITYFFNDGNEELLAHEQRLLIPSLGSKKYDQSPLMSAPAITDAVINKVHEHAADFYLINYANADMVGHSGNMHATIKAVECLDHQLQRLYTTIVLEQQGALLITGDHGNAEAMFDPQTNQPKTSHTTNPVYGIIVNETLKDSAVTLDLHALKDIAPFILEQLHIPVPESMQ